MKAQPFDDESETPRGHIEDFLSNVGTDPHHILSSKRSGTIQRLTRSFVRTPAKSLAAKEAISTRLSTSLSPRNLLTPRTNIHHLLLGSDSVQTPLDRRVASARSTKSHSKSLLNLAPSEWGQKVSMSPMFSNSPSSSRTDVESSAKLWTRSKQRRSFYIPEPSSDIKDNFLQEQATLQDGDHVGKDEGYDDRDGRSFNKEADEGNIVEGTGEAARESFNQNRSEIGSVQKSYNRRKNSTASSKDMIHDLHQISKVMLNETASNVYDLNSNSTDDDAENELHFSYSVSPRKGSPNKKMTPNKTRTPIGDKSQKSFSRSRYDGRSGNETFVGQSISLREDESDVVDDDSNKDSQNQSRFMSMKSVSGSRGEVVPSVQDTPGSSSKRRSRSGIKTFVGQSMSVREDESDVMDDDSNKVLQNQSRFMSMKSVNRSRGEVIPSETNTSNPNNTTASKLARSMQMLNTPVSSSKKRRSSRSHLENYVVSDDKAASLQQERDLSGGGNGQLLNDDGDDSPSDFQVPSGKPPRRSSSRGTQNLSVSMEKHSPGNTPRKTMMNSSRSTRASSGSLNVGSTSPISISRSSRKRNQSNLNDSSNPYSSTPLKRTKSVFTSSRMQASISNDMVPKDLGSANKSSHGISIIGGISPIRTVGEHGENIQGPDLATSDNEETVVEANRGNKSEHSRTRKSLMSVSLRDEGNKDENESTDGEDDYESPSYTPMKTPKIDMTKQPLLPVSSGKKSSFSKRQLHEPVVPDKKSKATSSSRKPSTSSTSIIPRKTVKFFSELYSSMKLDKEALDQLETLSEQFMVNTLGTVSSYCHHARRKVINEADVVLLMKIQKLIKNKEDLYDLIRKYLPMELRCELIPCFPSK